MQRNRIPVSVIVVTRNEEARIQECLQALKNFDDVWVVDSNSEDETCAIAKAAGAQVVDFTWDGQYPKKRQWCLEHLELQHDWVFFVDADEVVMPELVDEIAALDFDLAGYFVRGRYIWNGKMLHHGLCNNKLVLFDRRRVEFPVVDDLDLPGMGEIEGHYQPVLKNGFECEAIGQLKNSMLHYACDDSAAWEARHERYAFWEAGMNARDAWPKEPVFLRQILKRVFRRLLFRGAFAFVQSYIWKLGFMDGVAGFDFARARARYYGIISAASRANKAQGRDGGAANSAPEVM